MNLSGKMTRLKYLVLTVLAVVFCLMASPVSAQENHDHSDHDHSTHQHDDHGHDDHAKDAKNDHGDQGHGEEAHGCGGGHHGHEFDPGSTAFHHVGDANVFSIGPFQIPLPCILYAPEHGWSVFSSGKFHIHDAHGNGEMAIDRYVLDEGRVKRVKDKSFPMGEVKIGGFSHDENGNYVCYNNAQYEIEKASKADGGLFGGGITSFYDFSLTKNVVSMILVALFLGWMMIKVANMYKKREGQAPTGVQGFIEPMFVFIQDEVAKPFLGHHWERFTPFLMCLFFFILGLNLFGQIPFLGGSNVTGNLAVTMVLAIFTFLVTNFNGNKHYWEHTLWMPGVPALLKVLILTPVEILGLFIKPITLMLRLFANITAGHMVVVIFVGLIFVFGGTGAEVNAGAAYGTAIGSVLLTMFISAIELLVAFIQAFVFTILTASYLGAATEEAHH
jgi:F-type H+-transporting ATPase subunit a